MILLRILLAPLVLAIMLLMIVCLTMVAVAGWVFDGNQYGSSVNTPTW